MVVFKFKEGADQGKMADLIAEYKGFPNKYRDMRNFSIGRNISERDKTFEWGFSVDFESEVELKAYLNSASHEQHVVERFRPLIENRAIVSYVIEDTKTCLKV